MTFDVGFVIQDEIAQAFDTNPRVELFYGCLIIKQIVVHKVPPTKDNETVKYISDLGYGTISRFSAKFPKNKTSDVGPREAAGFLGDDEFKNLVEPQSSRPNFEDETKTHINALSTQMGAMQTLCEGINSWVTDIDEKEQGIRTDVTVVLSMVQDMHAHQSSIDERSLDH